MFCASLFPPLARCLSMLLIVGSGLALPAKTAAAATTPLSLTWQAAAPAELSETATEDGTTWHLLETMPDGNRVLSAYTHHAELTALGADTLQLDVRVQGSETTLVLEVMGYPRPDDHRRYYLEKLRVGPASPTWHRLALPLAIDDDSRGPLKEIPPQVEVRLTAELSPKGVTEAAPRLELWLGPPRFAAIGLQLSPAPQDLVSRDRVDALHMTHHWQLSNTATTPRAVRLELDRQQLKHFDAHVHPEALSLAPGETAALTVHFSIARNLAATLPPLHAEPVALHVKDAANGTFLRQAEVGYVPAWLYGVIPPAERPHPWFKPAQPPEDAAVSWLATEAGKRHLQQAEELLAIDPTPPALLHGNPNHYFDPTTNSQMRFHGIGRTWSEGQKAYVNVAEMPERVQRAEAYQHHLYLAKAALTLAEIGWLTGEKTYSRKAADILLAYAERYPTYPPSDPRTTAFQARVGWAMLMEAWWLDPLIEAADLVLGSATVTDAEAETIRNGLMLTAARTIRLHRIQSNQQAEVNATYGGAALIAGRHDLAAEALAGPVGIRAQWELDFDEDGYSIERDMPYHFAALGPMTRFADQLESLGISVYDDRFKRLFLAPLAHSLDGRVPMHPWVYRSAARHWPEPLLRAMARRLSPSLDTLIHPLPEPPATGEPLTLPAVSTLQHAGYTVFRQTPREGAPALAATINWGSPAFRGGQVLLSPAFFFSGKPLNAQGTRIAYGYQGSGFSFTPAAGNGLLVGGQGGSMLSAEYVADIQQGLVTAGLWRRDTRAGWPEVAWNRAIALLGSTAVTVDLVQAREAQTFDFLWMLPDAAHGNVVGLAKSAEPWPVLADEGHGYDRFTDPTLQGQGLSSWSLTYPLNRHHQGRFQGLSEGLTWLTATSRTGWHPKPTPLNLMRLADRRSGWLVTTWRGNASPRTAPTPVSIERLAAPQPVDQKPAEKDQALAIALTTPEGRWALLITNDPEPRDYRVGDLLLRGPLAIEPLPDGEQTHIKQLTKRAS